MYRYHLLKWRQEKQKSKKKRVVLQLIKNGRWNTNECQLFWVQSSIKFRVHFHNFGNWMKSFINWKWSPFQWRGIITTIIARGIQSPFWCFILAICFSGFFAIISLTFCKSLCQNQWEEWLNFWKDPESFLGNTKDSDCRMVTASVISVGVKVGNSRSLTNVLRKINRLPPNIKSKMLTIIMGRFHTLLIEKTNLFKYNYMQWWAGLCQA